MRSSVRTNPPFIIDDDADRVRLNISKSPCSPGDGFVMESMEAKAMKPARWFADHGIAAFVLNTTSIRRPRRWTRSSRRRWRFAAAAEAGAKGGADIPAPVPALADAQAAMRPVRACAARWGVDPKRVAYVGFSAGAIMGVDLVRLRHRARCRTCSPPSIRR